VNNYTSVITTIQKSARDRSLLNSFLIAIVSLFFLLILTQYFLTGVGLALCVFSFLLFINRLGRSVPVLELMLFMAALQWILGPYIAYRLEFQHFKYIMYVNEDVYMGVIIPGYICFLTGVLLFIKQPDFTSLNLKLRKLANEQPRIAYFMIIIGLVLPFFNSLIPISLQFIVYLLANLKYIGVALLFFQEKGSNKWKWMLLVMGLTFLSSLQLGMFHDLILWSALLFSFLAIRLKLNTFIKFIFILAAFYFAFLLQGIKNEYRDIISDKPLTNTEKIGVFSDLLFGQFKNTEEETTNSQLGMINVRLNQGWIISAIIYNIPSNAPFANGETIFEAIYASLVPRFLDPGKKMAGGRENFERFTGLPIRSNTSMGTSIIGEAYGNFGKEGAWIFMFIWGFVLSKGYNLLMSKTNKTPLLYLFLPLIFLQVIKAETEFSVVFNHFVKSLVFVFLFLWFARRYLKWQV